MSEVIYAAWKNGTKFDAWQDQRRFDAWTSAFRCPAARPGFLHPPPAPLPMKFSPGNISRLRFARNTFMPIISAPWRALFA